MISKKKKQALACGLLTLAFLLLGGCQNSASQAPNDAEDPAALLVVAYPKETAVECIIEDEEVPLSSAPAIAGMMPQASGTAVNQNEKAIVDHSNIKDGYVMVKYSAATDKKLKAQVKGPTETYTYNLTPGSFETLPLSDGNGNYQITVFENVSGTSYATVLSASITVQLTDEFAPFLRPNQYVNYTPQSQVVAQATALTAGVSEPLAKVEKVYDYVVNNLTYDKNRAQNVQSGYLPVLDSVLAEKKGICFDYASLMAAMLRSQGVPVKLVVGHSQSVYHAWINVYTPESGWIEGAIFFDGAKWQLMDPTFASSAKQSKEIMEYIGNGANYSAKYLY